MIKIKQKKFIKDWGISIAIALMIFFAIKPVFAQTLGQKVQFSLFVMNNDLEVGAEVIGGHNHIYYIYNGKKVFVTDGILNSKMPDTSKEYITWVTNQNGAGQIFLYHIPTEKTIAITNSRR